MKMQLSEYKKHCLEVINRNYAGRKIVCYGEPDKECQNYMFEKYGLSISFLIVRNEKNCDGERIKPASILKKQNSDYYVISFSKKTGDSDWLLDFGYVNVEDFLFLLNDVHIVPKDAKNYKDKWNNSCNFCPPNCTIEFSGRNSEIVIPPDVKVSGSVKIELKDDCRVIFGSGVSITNGYIRLCDCSSINVGQKVIINNPDFSLAENATLTVGDETTFNHYPFIRVSAYNTVNIGKRCMFAANVHIFCGDGHAIFDVLSGKRLNSPLTEDNDEKYTVNIGDHVWLGIKSLLLNGASIGLGCVVGGYSVVKKKFPNNCSIVGNPAKIARKNIAWSRNIMAFDIESCGTGYYDLTSDMEEKEDLPPKSHENTVNSEVDSEDHK